jgi:Tol biopolymer transport system component
MRWTAGLLIALAGCTTAPSDRAEVQGGHWDAPPARLVSDLGRFDHRFTYNETSSVSDGGRWVVFTSHVKDRPGRLFLVDTELDRLRQIDDSYDGAPRASEGVGRYSIAFHGGEPEITPDGRFVVFISAFRTSCAVTTIARSTSLFTTR